MDDYGDYLPMSIKTLTCSYKFKKPLKRNNNIPKNVRVLVLDNYNFPIIKQRVPETIHTLALGSNFKDFESLSKLPQSSIFNLTLGVENCELTDEEIKQFIPKTITKLTKNRTNYPFDKSSVDKHDRFQWFIDYKNPIGKGGCSIGVFKGKKLDGKINNILIPNEGCCAIKIVLHKEMGKHEIITLNKLIGIENENIIKFYGYGKGVHTDGQECLFIYMEYLEGYETISDIFKNKRVTEPTFNFSELQIAKVIKYFCESLKLLHEQGVENCNLSNDDFKKYTNSYKNECQ
ncbi:hypothetical protein DICPUDRAFT_74775 [Dictyostelium purpureum]|uniref:Protein kinase domain-containing protein n=1 Tax=Dictyostelium purpureum TaxID=5786 RepID=F0Z8Q1_DICPU|nr:uncharacterized protein DICPUDRAFT_74775 [Dictyostelium purpureum]EGC39698.1 hypothetical protein DICPUDRAFT_74775 [Dictyostelium purpureum]|eukprot:XP_003283807.1 hypothetical protein DICPUDRAFT_74775 [Dictyostelium purpureum]